MKIVYTVAKYYPNMDGVQSVTQKQAEALAQTGHEVVVICGNKQGNCMEEIHNDVKILRVDAYNKFIWHRGEKRDFQVLVERECRNADVLITVCMSSFATNWVLNILEELRCRKILYLHGIADFNRLILQRLGITDYFYRKIKQIYWKIYYAFAWQKIKTYDAIVHIHEKDGSLDYIQRKGYEKNYIVYNAVEDALFETEESKNNKKYFINVANYLVNKNQKMLLQSYYKSGVLGGLIFIGSQDNIYYQKLVKYKKKLERRYGHKDVKLLYNVKRHEVEKYIRNAVAMVMTSKIEQFPLTILEAMAVGKPYISSDVGIVSCLPGGIIYHGTNELIDALRKLDHDEVYCSNLGKKGNIYAKNNLTMKHHMECMNAVLQAVMQEAVHE